MSLDDLPNIIIPPLWEISFTYIITNNPVIAQVLSIIMPSVYMLISMDVTSEIADSAPVFHFI